MTGRDRGATLAEAVGPSSSGTVEYVVQADEATVESFDIRFYSGAGFALRLWPKVVRENGSSFDLVRPRGKSFIDGDDDHFTWSLTEPVTQNDKIVIEYENVSSQYQHSFRANIDVDEREGTTSFAGWLDG